jgi:hypothetical protein
VESQTGESGEQAGFGSTVSIDGIRTVMNDIQFAYCEFPRSWGVVDSEGKCTVKVDGARVGISYDIVINTHQLMRLVNHGVELSKNEEKLTCFKDRVQARWGGGGSGGGDSKGDDGDGSGGPSTENGGGTDDKGGSGGGGGKGGSDGGAAGSRVGTRDWVGVNKEGDGGGSPAPVPADIHQAADAALDRAFGSFGIATEEDERSEGGYSMEKQSERKGNQEEWGRGESETTAAPMPTPRGEDQNLKP